MHKRGDTVSIDPKMRGMESAFSDEEALFLGTRLPPSKDWQRHLAVFQEPSDG